MIPAVVAVSCELVENGLLIDRFTHSDRCTKRVKLARIWGVLSVDSAKLAPEV